MKLNTFRTLPRFVGIAFSGGIDSVVMMHVALSLNRYVSLYTFDHGTETSAEEKEFANYTARKYCVPVSFQVSPVEMQNGDSKERFWSEARNNWFHSFSGCLIATGHHLNDVAEWYLMTALTGNGGFIMNYANKNVIRPLITTPRSKIEEYAEYHKLEYIKDPTNDDIDFNKRNRVRHELLPKALEVNPGLLKTLKRRIIDRENRDPDQTTFFVE